MYILTIKVKFFVVFSLSILIYITLKFQNDLEYNQIKIFRIQEIVETKRKENKVIISNFHASKNEICGSYNLQNLAKWKEQ